MTVADQSQCMAALKVANEVRAAGAKVRRELRGLSFRDGTRLAARMLGDRDPRIQAMPVGRFLLAVPRVGDDAAARILRSADVRLSNRKVRDLTDRQIQVICRVLTSWEMYPHSRDRKAAA